MAGSTIALFVVGGLAIVGVAVIAPMLFKGGGSQDQAQPTSTIQAPDVASSNQGAPPADAAAPGQPAKRIVIIGGGLSGCTAALSAHAALQNMQLGGQDQVEIVLVDKMPKIGGNSAKASSGINALNEAGGDSQELFESDTLQSGGGLSKPELVHTLVSQSPKAIQFLSSLGVDLSKVTVLGGHSKPRSRTNPVGGNVGWSIMSKAMAAVKEAPGVRVLEGHKLEELLMDPTSGSIRGVGLSVTTHSHEHGAPQETLELPAQAVILATGGFAANRGLLAQYNPESATLATTNGPWAQGDVIAVATRVGAKLKDMEQVQVHPTGFIDPADESAGTKFLAPEKLRGVGAVMFNKSGQRFVDELSTRDVVAKAVADQPGSEAFLVLSAPAAEDYGMSAIQFYVAKKLMTKVGGVSGLAQHMGIPDQESTLVHELETYNKAKEGQHADPWGKTVFPTGFDLAGDMYVARITPVVHYTMGGVEIDEHARVLTEAGQPIPGLYAAGEVSGGVHGRNRLGGNSLLECTVFGRIAGSNAVSAVVATPAAATSKV